MPQLPTKELRQFGFLMGAFLIGMFGLFFPWVFVKPSPQWPWVVAPFFIGIALLLPRALGPVHFYWMKFAHVMGWINSRILLGVFFYAVVAPIGFLRRIIAKDPMGNAFDKKRLTYRINRGYDKDQSIDMKQPF